MASALFSVRIPLYAAVLSKKRLQTCRHMKQITILNRKMLNASFFCAPASLNVALPSQSWLEEVRVALDIRNARGLRSVKARLPRWKVKLLIFFCKLVLIQSEQKKR